MSGVFDNFPKQRIILPEAYQKIYLAHYKSNRAGSTPASFFSGKLERWLHKKVAEDIPGEDTSTLEIGAGTLNHLPYEKWATYDIVEPFSALYNDSDNLNLIQTVYKDIEEITEHHKYNRIISIANFEHILDLPRVVAKTCLLLKPGGCLRVAMPNEGHITWKMGYMLTTGVEFRLRYGLSYSVLMQHEHVNTANEIEDILRYFFKDVKIDYLGLNKEIAFYRFCECSGPREELATQFLSRKIN